MEKLLEGKVCIVTGAARGIGKATAMKYAQHGANVVLIDLNKESIAGIAEEIESLGVRALSLAVDVTSSKEINNAFLEIEDKFTKIDVLANCAGIVTSKLILDIEEEEWDRVFNVNLKSIFLLSKRVAKNMVKNKVANGKIISISSQASKIGEVGNGAYCASKAGVNSLTQVLGLELAEYGISVNSVCPGYVNTEMMQQVFQKRGPIEGMTPQEYEESLTSQVPMKRLAEPEEIAELMLFLSSEKANYITGISITIAGGKTII
ncbi:SDR family NAD(P)-dependent oxidoreductase [Priestia abyssalis]|uniref:SDR family NAD(P)-dependent oxidoreductase n=1 Tax=Priestia abyssalis TaxID=1221450 RepID=UPI0009951E93|nr:glucose 1-dehydrogenase [Priestia abyssalis]